MQASGEFSTTYTEEVYRIPPPVTVVIDIPWIDISEEQRQLLNKILLAVRLSLDAVRIIHQVRYDASGWSERPTKVIAFVDPPKGLTAYEVIQTGESAVVFSEPLARLFTDDTAKRSLWGALKSLFQA